MIFFLYKPQTLKTFFTPISLPITGMLKTLWHGLFYSHKKLMPLTNTIISINKISFMKTLLQQSKFGLVIFLVLSLCFVNTSFGQATSIWTNPITGTNPNTSNPYTTGDIKNANLTVSGIGRGIGLTSNNANDRYNASAWQTGGALGTTDYFNWIITPGAGYHVNLSSFVYTGQVSTGTPSFSFRSNAAADNYLTDIPTAATAGATISLIGANYQNLTAATQFRLYGWSFSTTGTTYSVNDFTFNGAVLGTSVTTLTGFSACINTAGIAQSFTINGAGLTNATDLITVAGSTNYEVSVTSATTGFATSVTFNAAGAAVAAQTVWVRLKANAVAATYNSENINVSGGGFSVANAINVVCSGSVNPVSAVGAVSADQIICSGSSPSGNITIASSTGTVQWQRADDLGFTIGLITVGTNSNTLTIAQVGALTATKYFRAVVTSGACAAATSGTVTVTVNPPATVTPGATLNITQCQPATPLPITLTGASFGGAATTAAWSITSGGGTLSSTAQTANPELVTYTPLANYTGAVVLTLTTNAPGACPAVNGTRTINISNPPNIVTLVNYDFNIGTSFLTLTPILATGITSAVTSTDAFTSSGTSTATGLSAFTANTTAGNALRFTGVVGQTKSWTFSLAGSNLPRYKTYKVYCQVISATNGYNTVTLLYNLNGAGFVSTGVSPATVTVGTTYVEALFTLPSTVDNPITSLAFQVAASGGTSAQTFRIDNFQVQGVYTQISDKTITSSAATVCSGTGTNIQIATSEIGVNYQLRNNVGNVLIGSAVAGTGGTINLPTGNLSAGTTFNVLASDGVGCDLVLATLPAVAVWDLPAITAQPATPAATCAGSGTQTISVTATGDGLTYSWRKGGIAVVDGGAISGQGTNTLTLTNPTASDAGNYDVIVSGTCAPAITSNAVTVTVASGYTWYGTTDATWGTSTNWSACGVPASGADITIATTGINPILPGNLTVGSLTINAGNTLTIGSNTLTVNGSITGTGTLTGSSSSNLVIGGTAGSVNFTTGAQILKDFTINAGASATLGTPLAITAGAAAGTVIVDGTLNTADILTIKSDANGTARVGQSAGAITGKVTIERFVQARRAWRFLTAPIESAGAPTIKAAWMEGGQVTVIGNTSNPSPGYGTHITGSTTIANGFDQNPAGNPSTKKTVNVWTGIGNTLDPVTTEEGYMVFVRGSRANQLNLGVSAPLDITNLRVTGTLKQGTKTYTQAGTGSEAKTIGNPYASALLLPVLWGAANNIPMVYSVWDPMLTGTNNVGGFITYSWNGSSYSITPLSGSAVLRTGIVESGSAFILQYPVSGITNTLTLGETDKTTGSVMSQLTEVVGEQMRINLNKVNPDATVSLQDGMLTEYDAPYSNSVDAYDAVKVTNFTQSMSSKRDGKKLAIERRAVIVNTDTTYLDLIQMSAGNYQLQLIADNLNHPSLLGKLVDNYTSSNTVLSLHGSSAYAFTVDANAGSFAADRFKVVYYAAAPLPVSFTSIKATQQNKDIAVEWQVANQVNISKYEVEKSTDGRHFTTVATQQPVGINGANATYNWLDVNAATGNHFYRISSTGFSGDIKLSSIVKVTIGKGIPAIVVYPNPVVNNTIALQFTDMPKGDYGIRLMNMLGQTVQSKQLTHSGSNTTQRFAISQGIARGNYRLQIVTPDGETWIQKIVIAQ